MTERLISTALATLALCGTAFWVVALVTDAGRSMAGLTALDLAFALVGVGLTRALGRHAGWWR